MHAFSFTAARANLKALMDKAIADRAPVFITRQGKEGVVLISQSEWESIEETLHLLSSPANAKRLLGAIDRMNAGKGEEHELIDP